MTLFTSSVASFFLRITRKLKKIAWPSDDVSKDICLPGCCCSQHTFTSFSYIVIVSQSRFPFRKYRVRMYSKMGRKVKRDRASWVFSLGRGPFEFYCLWESQQQLLKSPELNCSKKTSWGNEGKRFKYQEKDLEKSGQGKSTQQLSLRWNTHLKHLSSSSFSVKQLPKKKKLILDSSKRLSNSSSSSLLMNNRSPVKLLHSQSNL